MSFRLGTPPPSVEEQKLEDNQRVIIREFVTEHSADLFNTINSAFKTDGAVKAESHTNDSYTLIIDTSAQSKTAKDTENIIHGILELSLNGTMEDYSQDGYSMFVFKASKYSYTLKNATLQTSSGLVSIDHLSASGEFFDQYGHKANVILAIDSSTNEKAIYAETVVFGTPESGSVKLAGYEEAGLNDITQGYEAIWMLPDDYSAETQKISAEAMKKIPEKMVSGSIGKVEFPIEDTIFQMELSFISATNWTFRITSDNDSSIALTYNQLTENSEIIVRYLGKNYRANASLIVGESFAVNTTENQIIRLEIANTPSLILTPRGELTINAGAFTLKAVLEDERTIDLPESYQIVIVTADDKNQGPSMVITGEEYPTAEKGSDLYIGIENTEGTLIKSNAFNVTYSKHITDMTYALKDASRKWESGSTVNADDIITTAIWSDKTTSAVDPSYISLYDNGKIPSGTSETSYSLAISFKGESFPKTIEIPLDNGVLSPDEIITEINKLLGKAYTDKALPKSMRPGETQNFPFTGDDGKSYNINVSYTSSTDWTIELTEVGSSSLSVKFTYEEKLNKDSVNFTYGGTKYMASVLKLLGTKLHSYSLRDMGYSNIMNSKLIGELIYVNPGESGTVSLSNFEFTLKWEDGKKIQIPEEYTLTIYDKSLNNPYETPVIQDSVIATAEPYPNAANTPCFVYLVGTEGKFVTDYTRNLIEGICSIRNTKYVEGVDYNYSWTDPDVVWKAGDTITKEDIDITATATWKNTTTAKITEEEVTKDDIFILDEKIKESSTGELYITIYLSRQKGTSGEYFRRAWEKNVTINVAAEK